MGDLKTQWPTGKRSGGKPVQNGGTAGQPEGGDAVAVVPGGKWGGRACAIKAE